MHLVILESPFAGNVKKNILYGRLCVRDSLSRGEAPVRPTSFTRRRAS